MPMRLPDGNDLVEREVIGVGDVERGGLGDDALADVVGGGHRDVLDGDAEVRLDLLGDLLRLVDGDPQVTKGHGLRGPHRRETGEGRGAQRRADKTRGASEPRSPADTDGGVVGLASHVAISLQVSPLEGQRTGKIQAREYDTAMPKNRARGLPPCQCRTQSGSVTIARRKGLEAGSRLAPVGLQVRTSRARTSTSQPEGVGSHPRGLVCSARIQGGDAWPRLIALRSTPG